MVGLAPTFLLFLKTDSEARSENDLEYLETGQDTTTDSLPRLKVTTKILVGRVVGCGVCWLGVHVATKTSSQGGNVDSIARLVDLDGFGQLF